MAVVDWPETLIPQESSFSPEPNDSFAESPLSRAQQVASRQGGRWRASLAWSSAIEEFAGPIEGIVAWLDGRRNEVRLFDFRRPEPRGTANWWNDAGTVQTRWVDTDGSRHRWLEADSQLWQWRDLIDVAPRPQLRAPALRGATTLSTWGWRAGEAVLRAGDRIGIDGRIYLVCFGVTATVEGAASLAIWPALRADTAAGVWITTSKPRARFRLASQFVEFASSPGLVQIVNGDLRAQPVTRVQLEFIESLP